MRIPFYIIFILSFFSQIVDCQMILNPRFFGGYVVNQKNDTIHGTIKLPKSAAKGDFSYTDILWKVRFVDKAGQENKFFASDLKAFTFWLDNGKQVNFVSRPNTVKAFGGFSADNKYLFLELAINGHLKLLKGYFYTLTPNGRQVDVINYLQKGQGKLFRYRYVLFRLDLADYLKENSVLAEKIRKRNYHQRDIEQIVREYNIWYNNSAK